LRLALITNGTRGDIAPYLALGSALRDEGLLIRIVTNKTFEEDVNRAGFEFASLSGNIKEFFQSNEVQTLLDQGDHFKLMRRFVQITDTLYELAFDEVSHACKGVDGIIFNGSTLVPSHVGEKLGCPLLTASFLPIAPTRSFPNPVFPDLPNLGPLLNKLSHLIVERPFWWRYMARTNRWRIAAGLPSIGHEGAYNYFNRLRLPYLFCYSPQLVPTAYDWPEWMHVTGYWHPVRSSFDYQPPAELVQFLASGPPPVYCGFGSMGSARGRVRTQIVLEALRKNGQRGILYAGWGGLDLPDPLPDNCLAIQDCPHDWLLPQCVAAIHHGGAGTLHTAARAGTPQIVLAHLGDQLFWGNRLAALGVASKPLTAAKLTFSSLSNALHRALTDKEMRDAATTLAGRMKNDRGVYRAVELILRAMQ
jgi:sterol 3beta-glucosyltransferase